MVNRARRRVLRDAAASLRLCALQLARSPGERAHFLGRPCAPLGLVAVPALVRLEEERLLSEEVSAPKMVNKGSPLLFESL